MKNYFKRHLAAVDETYFQHFSNAMRYALTMLGAGVICLAHAIFPFFL